MLEAASGVYTEIQPGSYVMMDIDYAKNEQELSWPTFEQSLMILTTVMSRRHDAQSDRATLDAGLKSFSTDSGPALPAFAGWQVREPCPMSTLCWSAPAPGRSWRWATSRC